MGFPKRNEFLTEAGELAACIDDRRLRILDCRFDLMAPEAGHKAWLDAHIPGAVYADLEKDLSGRVTRETGRHPLPAVQHAVAAFSRLGIDDDTRVVVYDDAGGAIAARAWWMLRWLGHEDVTVLDGGLQAWRRRKLPLESGARTVTAVDFSAVECPERVLGTQEIISQLGSASGALLIDARDATRYRGEAEPIDTKAGHVPGSRNLPYTACLRQDGTWLDAEALRERLTPLLGGDLGAAWAVMCGSGVTACHVAISGLLAGYREPRLYVGSWSEWIRDPGRPIGLGSENR